MKVLRFFSTDDPERWSSFWSTLIDRFPFIVDWLFRRDRCEDVSGDDIRIRRICILNDCINIWQRDSWLTISVDVNDIGVTINLIKLLTGIKKTFVDDKDAHRANSFVHEPINRKCPLKSLYASQSK